MTDRSDPVGEGEGGFRRVRLPLLQRLRNLFALPTLARLEAAVAQQAEEMAILRLEWAEVLDKLDAWSKRASARDRKRVAQNLDTLALEPPELPQDEPNGRPPMELPTARNSEAGTAWDRRAAVLRSLPPRPRRTE